MLSQRALNKMANMRLVTLLLLFSISGFAQIDLRVKNALNAEYEHGFYFSEEQSFTAFKPSYFEPSSNDTISGILNDNLIEYSKVNLSPSKTQSLIINPAFEFGLGRQNFEDELVSSLGLGFNLYAKRGKDKWRLGLTYLRMNSNYMQYQREYILAQKVVPGMGVVNYDSRIGSNYLSGFLNYNANKYFNFEFGYGRNSIGDGYRSLLLSNTSNASPYFKMTTKFWKIQYTNLFTSHQHIDNVERNSNLFQRKFTATHFLDLQVTKWLNLGLFETIIWQGDKGKYNRGFDPNYLNPFIFYRPVEFSVGSSDNALVGANIKLTLPKKHILYSQVVLDEFLLSELQADFNQWRNPNDSIRSGWWANKYGIQLGWRKFEWFGHKGFNTRLEFNFVRPFTYAHTNLNQSYSHFNQSLAHPLGSNFTEVLGIVDYRKGKFLARAHFNFSEKGFSILGQNLGEDIQESNITRSKEYENTTGQGILNKSLYSDFSLTYVWQEKWNASASLGYIYRNQDLGPNQTNNMIYLKIHTNLFNSYFDY